MRMGNVQRALDDATSGRTSVLDSATMPKHAGQCDQLIASHAFKQFPSHSVEIISIQQVALLVDALFRC